MSKLPLIYKLMVLVIIFSGCQKENNQPTPVADNPQPIIKYVESPQLAELILKPKANQLMVSKDPFKPIMTKEEMDSANSADSSDQRTEATADNIVLVGVVKIGDEYSAYINYQNKSGVFKVQDKVGDYIVKEINLDQVVLMNGDQTIIRKRGEI